MIKMKPLLAGVACLLAKPVLAQVTPADPFRDELTEEQKAIQAAPATWEATCEVFSLPFAKAAKLKREKGNIYPELLKLLEKKEAVMEEFAILKATVGLKARMQSVEGLIYPTEYDPPETPNKFSKLLGNGKLAESLVVPSTPTSFEVRDLGVEMAFSIDSLETPTTVLANLSFSLVTSLGIDRWGEAKAEAEMPRFRVQGLEKKIQLASGKPTLIGTMSPSGVKGGNDNRVWFLFATARPGEK
jgi:hypothetical protein